MDASRGTSRVHPRDGTVGVRLRAHESKGAHGPFLHERRATAARVQGAARVHGTARVQGARGGCPEGTPTRGQRARATCAALSALLCGGGGQTRIVFSCGARWNGVSQISLSISRWSELGAARFSIWTWNETVFMSCLDQCSVGMRSAASAECSFAIAGCSSGSMCHSAVYSTA